LQVNPYFTDDGISRSFELFTRTTRAPEFSLGDYKIRTNGGNVKFGVPFSEVDTVFFGAGVEQTSVETFSTPSPSPDLYREYVRDFGDDPVNGFGTAKTTSFPLTAAWQRDSRDSALVPTIGRYQRANLEVSLFGDLRYYRGTYQHQYFRPIFNGTTLALNGEINYGSGLGGKPYPIFKNFYAGGIGSVRGFEGSSLSVNPQQGVDPVGGQARLIGSAELQFPFPGSGANRTLRWFTFLDAGNVFDVERGDKMSLSNLRYSAGVGISWISPIGPLKLSFGKPLNAKPFDRAQTFQFQLGTGF
jgi:outer membrane protein insertion porin family